MEDFIKNKETSDVLFHQFIRCTHLMRAGMHRGRGMEMEMGFGPHGHHGHHGEMSGHHHGELKGADMQRIGQGRLLAFLLEKDGISQKELSELLRITAASVSELINKLENDGYIERKQNESDKRVTNIFLTEGGRFFSQKMEEARLQVAKDFFVALGEDEQTQLLSLIQKVIDSISDGREDCNFGHHHCKFGENLCNALEEE